MNQERLRAYIEKNAEFRFSRSGGPGGQNVNKVETKVQLLLNLLTLTEMDGLSPDELWRAKAGLAGRCDSDGNLLVTVDEERFQARNREIAINRALSLLAGASRPQKKRVPTKPTRASKLRTLLKKKNRSTVKNLRRKPRTED